MHKCSSSLLVVAVSVVFAVCVALPRAAHASKNVVVLDLTISGDAPAALRDLMLRSIEQGLADGGYNVIDARTVKRRLRRSPELVGCVSTTCMTQLAELLGADHFVRARIEAQGAAYNFELELLSAEAQDSLINRVESTCAVCTLSEANESIRRAAKRLPDAPHKADHTDVRIESTPAGATAFINGVQKGPTPLTVKLEPGTYTVRLTYTGDYIPAQEQVKVAKPSGEGPQVASFTLLASSVMVHGSRYGAIKWIATVGALAGIGGGVALFLVDGKGAGGCVNEGATRICRDLYDTKLFSYISMGVGGALAVTSVVMFMTDDYTHSNTGVAVVPAEGGAAVFVRGRF